MLSRAIWPPPLFLSILIQNGGKHKNIVDQILRGGGACCAPLWIRHWEWCRDDGKQLGAWKQVTGQWLIENIRKSSTHLSLSIHCGTVRQDHNRHNSMKHSNENSPWCRKSNWNMCIKPQLCIVTHDVQLAEIISGRIAPRLEPNRSIFRWPREKVQPYYDGQLSFLVWST